MAMRLLNTTTLKFNSSVASETGSSTPYAVLSHRWAGDSESEVLFEDILNGKALEKPCYQKVRRAAEAARADGFEWIWIDTCCINKQSSAELTESINSMYMWYQNAGCCYVYLQDVYSEAQFSKSNWFERGWTLQELIAPLSLKFYDHNWMPLGTRGERVAEISKITGIDGDALRGEELQNYSIAQKMSWAALRVTTRPEDRAYCLLGIFDVNIVPIYGEGAQKAFIRLQEEIIKQDDDHSIFAWSMDSIGSEMSGLLAPEPRCFFKCSARRIPYESSVRTPFSMTNRGLSIELEIIPWEIGIYLAFIDSQWANTAWPLGIFLRRLSEDDQYVRIRLDGKNGVFVDEHGNSFERYKIWGDRPIQKRRVFVRPHPGRHHSLDHSSVQTDTFRIIRHDKISGNVSTEILHTVRLDRPWQFKILNLPSRTKLQQIAVGYDFDFNPVCLLTHIASRTFLKAPIVIQDGNRNGAQASEHNQGGESQGPNDRVWCLKGNWAPGVFRLILPVSGVSFSSVNMYHDNHAMIWVVDIEN